MPWPVNPRNEVTGTGLCDAKNNAFLFVMKTLETGEHFFDQVIPEVEDGHVRIIMKRGYHYF